MGSKDSAGHTRYFEYIWTYNKAKGNIAQIQLEMEFESGRFKKHHDKLVTECWLTSPNSPSWHKLRLSTFVHDQIRKSSDESIDPEYLLGNNAQKFYAISEFLSNAGFRVSYAVASSDDGEIDFEALMRKDFSWMDWHVFLYNNERFCEINGEKLFNAWGEKGRFEFTPKDWRQAEIIDTIKNMPPDTCMNVFRSSVSDPKTLDKPKNRFPEIRKKMDIPEIEEAIKELRRRSVASVLKTLPLDRLDKVLLRELFYGGYLKATCRHSPKDPYDVDGFVVSKSCRYIFPIELKEKFPTQNPKTFGIDMGRILMLLRICVPNSCNALYVIRETDKKTGRFVEWKYITLSDILMSSVWHSQTGGTGMTGGATQTVMIPYEEFSDITESTFDDKNLEKIHSMEDNVAETIKKHMTFHEENFLQAALQVLSE